jgi:hypothetical protein
LNGDIKKINRAYRTIWKMEKRQIKLIGNIVPLFQGANFRAQSIKYQSLRGGTIKIPLFHPG